MAVILPPALIQGEKDREVWEARLMEALRPFDGHPFDLTVFNPGNILVSFRILSEGEPLLIRDDELVGDLMEYVSRRYSGVNYRYQQALAEILSEVQPHEHWSGKDRPENSVYPGAGRGPAGVGAAATVGETDLEVYSTMVGLRNWIIHGYEEVNPERIYEIVTQGLGDLERFVRQITTVLK